MQIEYEATFINIDKDDIRSKLSAIGAKLVKPEHLQKRIVFNLPSGHEKEGGWLRVRDEGNKITMSLKIIDGQNITDQKEICLNIDSFDNAVDLLSAIGCPKKAYQETKRELWLLDGVEITIDEWPYLEPLVEVEGKSEEAVMEVSQKIGFDYSDALFCSADKLYEMKYGVSKDVINNCTPRITFNEPNPFLN
ncbi:MAG TPA: CYTH domain-containing protein [bacterium]|nr:CYTH domain-containing protein [bacterium]HPT29689.1 CYTH domain-containing protein [bacterium]